MNVTLDYSGLETEIKDEIAIDDVQLSERNDDHSKLDEEENDNQIVEDEKEEESDQEEHPMETSLFLHENNLTNLKFHEQKENTLGLPPISRYTNRKNDLFKESA